MSMTHYMELLATNQPWNLIIFMAIPVILAEALAITELYILLKRGLIASWVKILNNWCGIISGTYFVGVIVYLLINAVFPLTFGGGWRGPADVIAVITYLLAGASLTTIAILRFGWIWKSKTNEEKIEKHVFLVALFLVLAHIAMIFGMLKPEILGWNGEPMKMEEVVKTNVECSAKNIPEPIVHSMMGN
jgi:hypothetical protein